MPREIVEPSITVIIFRHYEFPPLGTKLRIKEITDSVGESMYVVQRKVLFFWINFRCFYYLEHAQGFLEQHNKRSKPTSKVIKHE